MDEGICVFEIPLGSNQKVLCQVVEHLGCGSFGNVFKVMTLEGKEFAMKTIECKGKTTDLESALREASALAKAKHDHIVKLFSVDIQYKYRTIPVVHLLMELCKGGTLNEALASSTNVEKNLRWMLQMSHAVMYLHKKGIAHRDLKPENILLTSDQDVKVADLGLACPFIPMSYFLSVYSTVYMKEEVGTPFWMAPEVFEQRSTKQSDVFSLGIIFHSIQERQFYVSLEGKKIFCLYIEKLNSENQLKKKGLGKAMQKHGEEVLKKVTFKRNGPNNDISKLIMKTLAYDFHQRPTASDVFEELKCIEKKFQKKQNVEMDVDEDLTGIDDGATEATGIDNDIISLGIGEKYTWKTQE